MKNIPVKYHLQVRKLIKKAREEEAKKTSFWKEKYKDAIFQSYGVISPEEMAELEAELKKEL